MLLCTAMTAAEFDRIFQERIDKLYNDYVSPAQRERIYKQAMYNAFEALYNSPIDQEWTDELRSFIKINQPYSLTNSSVSIPNVIPDYNHYLFSRVEYTIDQGLYFTLFTYDGTRPVVARASKPLPYRTGSKVTISGSSMAEVNTSVWLKQVSRTNYFLYSDEVLETPITSTQFSGTSGAIVETIVSNCVVQYSDERISRLDTPTKRNPRVIVNENKLTFYPVGATQVFIDYLSNPPVFITQTAGVFDNTFNLETVYPAKFLYQIIDKAEEIFNIQAKDPQSFRDGVNFENLNP